MSIEQFFVRPVTIQRAPRVVDSYGDATIDWTNPTTTTTKGWLAQVSENETGEFTGGHGPGRELLTVTRTVLQLPAGTDIRAQDRVIVDGVTYEVDGQPRRPWTPRGPHHVTVNLRAVEG